ncbi:nitrous oxide reductase accessory protein NosL [Pseudomonas brassicacearum]|uniref:nitrous oxide reductase accessory protein NosL n=1 Tax=Pseudomonas brassicacearum TaxID=930166 RepID=UPI0006405CB9|nr:nitrous oxide reductase accessory protein NosL [Pseudomonas brassicacearum]
MNTLNLIAVRILVVITIGLGLLACNDRAEEKQTLAPTAFHKSDECHVCGMVIADFPGPKGEVVAKDTVKKFCSTAEMLGWWLQPENHLTEAKLYVHDMGKSAWEKPDDNYLIDATKAYYVVGTRLKGSMGVVLASFSEEAAARKLASDQGGRVLRFEEINLTLLKHTPTM